MSCYPLNGSDSILLHQEFADPDDVILRHVLVIQRRQQGLRVCVIAVKALVQLMACTIPSSLYYVLASLPTEIPADVILACNRILASWPYYEYQCGESILTHLK